MSYNREVKEAHYPSIGDKHYVSKLFKDVPRTKITPFSPEYDEKKCMHCQEFPAIWGTFGYIVWCKRCYELHRTKGDGTKVEQSTIAIGKDLVDIQQGKVKVTSEGHVERKVVQDD